MTSDDDFHRAYIRANSPDYPHEPGGRPPATTPGVSHDWVSGQAAAHQDRVIALNVEYRQLTGRDFYLYTSRPGDGQTRCVFQDGIQHGYAAAEGHMQAELARAQAWHRGYEDQSTWLVDGKKTLAEAEQALEARTATQAPNPYNEGATAATRDYIANRS